MYRSFPTSNHVTPVGQCPPPRSVVTPRLLTNPYLARRSIVHSRNMPNPDAFPRSLPPTIAPTPAPTRTVMQPAPSETSWRLQPRYKASTTFVSAQHVLQQGFPFFATRNLEEDMNFESPKPTSNEPNVSDLDYGT